MQSKFSETYVIKKESQIIDFLINFGDGLRIHIFEGSERTIVLIIFSLNFSLFNIHTNAKNHSLISHRNNEIQTLIRV